MLSSSPFLIIISAPSGTGKTTLCRALLKRDEKIRYSISVTTRSRKAEEEHGKDYYFLSDKEFDLLVENGGLLEWEEVYRYRYGTPKDKTEELLAQGYNVLFDLDIKGAVNLKRRFPDSVTVFLLPPSMAELERRITLRGRDDADNIKFRLAQAMAEMEKAKEFDYIIVNDLLDESVQKLVSIIKAERCRSLRIREIKIV